MSGGVAGWEQAQIGETCNEDKKVPGGMSRMAQAGIHRKHILLTVLFSVYMFEYMMTLIFMDQSVYALKQGGTLIHYLRSPILAAGFLLFPFSRLKGGIRSRRAGYLLMNLAYAFSMLGVLYAGNPYASAVFSLTGLLALGALGGAVYYFVAMGFVNHPYLGRLTGAGGAAAFLMQIAAQQLISARLVFLIVMVLGFGLVIFASTRIAYEWMFEDPLEYSSGREKGETPGRTKILFGILAMCLLYFFLGVTDQILVSGNFAGDMTIYAWPRLGGALGYVLGGILADLGRRKWLEISAFCMTVIALPVPFMLSEGHTAGAAFLYYVVVLGQIVYMNLFFWDLAPMQKHPELWASLSRILSCLVMIFIPLISGFSVMASIMVETVITVAVILCISLGGYYPESREEGAEKKDRMADFVQRYGLTPRERDLLMELLQNDGNIQDVADAMQISQRAAYRHLNNVYEKTGTDSRHALLRAYYEHELDIGLHNTP
ncbi:MAG: hypothetical protein K6F35_08100 [Lachnospiraceae bacterium]|nr:hypothetical protein [Lachnospiraceae bacterium]